MVCISNIYIYINILYIYILYYIIYLQYLRLDGLYPNRHHSSFIARDGLNRGMGGCQGSNIDLYDQDRFLEKPRAEA